MKMTGNFQKLFFFTKKKWRNSNFQLNKLFPNLQGPLCDIMWSDPDDDVEDWVISQRGAGFVRKLTDLPNLGKKNKKIWIFSFSN